MKSKELKPIKWNYGDITVEYDKETIYQPYFVSYTKNQEKIFVGSYDSFDEAKGAVKLIDTLFQIDYEIKKSIDSSFEMGLNKAKMIIEQNHFPEKAQNSKL